MRTRFFRESKFRVLKYLYSAFLISEFFCYIQSATKLVSVNTIEGIYITYKTKLRMISLDIVFNIYRRVNVELTYAEIRAILILFPC